MPKQILKMRPYFSRCVDNFFTGFDPPRTLAPAAALAPSITTTSSTASTTAPKPSPTPDVGAKKTANSGPPLTTPSEIPAVGQPRKQDTQVPDSTDPKHQTSNPGKESHDLAPPELHPAQPGSKSEEINGDSQQGKKANTVPGEGKNPAPPFISVPTVSPGIAKAGSDQSTDPTSHDIPPLVGNADTMDVEPTDSHSQVQPGDPQHRTNATETTSGNNPSESHPLPWIKVDPGKTIPSESSPADEIKGDLPMGNANKFNPSTKAIDDPENEDSSSNKVPDKSNPADEISDESRNENPISTRPSVEGLQGPGMEKASALDSTEEPGRENPSRPHPSFEVTGNTGNNNPSNIDPSSEVMGGSKIENPSKVNLPTKGAQGPGIETTKESDPTHETVEDPEKEDPSKSRPLADVMKGNVENNPSDADPEVGGTRKEVLGGVNISDTIGDSEKEYKTSTNPSFGTTGDVEQDRSSNLDSSTVFPGNANPTALGQLLDITKDPTKSSLDKLDPSVETTGDSGKDGSSNSNPPVKFPTNESSSELESLFETPELPAQIDPTESNSSSETSNNSETGEDPAQPNDADNPDDLPQPNDETDNLDPYHTSPNQPHRIEAALSLSAQGAQLPPEPTQKRHGVSNHPVSPDPYGTFDHGRQTEPFPGFQPAAILNLQSSSSNNHAITATPVPVSEQFRTTSPSNGPLNPPSASANVTDSSARSSAGGAGVTAGSGINSLSAAPRGSSLSKDHANRASDVGAMNSGAGIAVGLLMFLGML